MFPPPWPSAENGSFVKADSALKSPSSSVGSGDLMVSPRVLPRPALHRRIGGEDSCPGVHFAPHGCGTPRRRAHRRTSAWPDGRTNWRTASPTEIGTLVPGNAKPPTSGGFPMRLNGVEPSRVFPPTRPSTLRVYQFRHSRSRALDSRCLRASGGRSLRASGGGGSLANKCSKAICAFSMSLVPRPRRKSERRWNLT